MVKYDYTAYGQLKSISGDNITLAHANPFRYKGYYYDSDLGMYYCKSRYYNPIWCRWLNADSIDNLDFTDINNMNLYAYCSNNPVMCYINSFVSFSRGNYSGNSYLPQRVVVVNNKRPSNTYFKTAAFQANSDLLGLKVSSHITRNLFNGGIMGVNLLKISLIRTRTLHSSGMLYSLADFGNDALSLGFGYSLGGWLGADYYYTSSGRFGFSSQISPWFSLGAELGLKDGLTIKAGVINGMTSDELSINVSTPVLGAFAVCGVIAAIPVPGARVVAGIGAVATSIFVLFTNI